MNTLKVLRYLREQKIYPIRPEHLVYKFGLKYDTAVRMLNRMSENNVVPKLYRGLWWNPFYPPPNPFCLHKTLAPESYISSITALWWHGIFNQRPYTITCLCRRNSFTCLNEYGKYEFTKYPNKLMFGYEEVPGQCFKIADAEKALLDYFYVTVFIKKAKPRLTEIDLEDLNPDKFLSYGKRMGKKMFAFLKETGLADSSRWNEFAPEIH